VFSEKLPEAERVVRRIRQTRFDLDLSSNRRIAICLLARAARPGIISRRRRSSRGAVARETLSTRSTPASDLGDALANGSFNFIRDASVRSIKDKHIHCSVVVRSRTAGDPYLPTAMPDPRAPEFSSIARSEIVRIINVTQGHAFVLCTSYSSMTALYELVSARNQLSVPAASKCPKPDCSTNSVQRQMQYYLRPQDSGRASMSRAAALMRDHR